MRIIKHLALPARHHKLWQPLRLWYILRRLDYDACGFIPREVVKRWCGDGFSRRRIDNWIEAGQGVLWTEIMTRTGEGPGGLQAVLQLTGVEQLAEYLGVGWMSSDLTVVPWPLVVGSTAQWNSIAYHATLQRGMTVRDHPFARASIRTATGIAERTQQRHHRVRFPGTKVQITTARANFVQNCPLPPRGVTKKARKALKGQRVPGLVVARIGNSYRSKLTYANFGTGRQWNRRLNDQARAAQRTDGSLHPQDRRARRYFKSGRSWLRAQQRGVLTYSDSLIWVGLHQRPRRRRVTRRKQMPLALPFVGLWARVGDTA